MDEMPEVVVRGEWCDLVDLPRGARTMLNAVQDPWALEKAVRSVGPWPHRRTEWKEVETHGLRLRAGERGLLIALWVDGKFERADLSGVGRLSSVEARKVLRSGAVIATHRQYVSAGFDPHPNSTGART